MKAFLSFGFYDIREQELVTSPVILEHLVDAARTAIAQCPGLELSAVLLPQDLPLPCELDLPRRYIRSGERCQSELEAVRNSLTGSEDEASRVMVLRPGQGALYLARVRHFYEAIQTRRDALLVSTIECASMVHPMWNLMVADRRFSTKNAIRHPRSGSSHICPLADACPELWRALGKEPSYRPGGSQHLPTLHRNDGALYSAMLGALVTQDEALPEPHAIPCPSQSDKTENLLQRLPVFQMSRELTLDVSTLEALLTKHRQNGGAL